MNINDLLRDMHDSYLASRRSETERGIRRRETYLSYTSRSIANDRATITPPWWRLIARIRHGRMLRAAELQAQRVQVIADCDACVGTFSIFNLPCRIHQEGEERELAVDLARGDRLRGGSRR